MTNVGGARAKQWGVENSVGRLVEVRLSSSDARVVTACLAACAAFMSTARAPLVGVFDVSRIRVLGKNEANLLLALMRENNPFVERCAFILSGETLLDMQMERLIRSAELPRRGAFCFPSQAVQWLAECLTDAETLRALAFLTEE